jgi:hypothetical protein
MWIDLLQKTSPELLDKAWAKAQKQAEKQSNLPQSVWLNLNGSIVRGLRHPMKPNDFRLHIAG